MTLVSRILSAKGHPGTSIKYEWAHRMCHPETCGHMGNYKILMNGELVDWADSEEEAKEAVESLKKLLLGEVN